MQNNLVEVSKKALLDEKTHINNLLLKVKLTEQQQLNIQQQAKSLTQNIKESKTSGVESFMQQYNLSTSEGVAIMCLAESLLRIPDSKTANELIEDKLKGKKWTKFLGQSDSLFVNSSTFGLMFSSTLLKASDIRAGIGKLVGTLSEPILRQALKQAMKIISNQFIMGSDIDTANKNAKKLKETGYNMSYDILGESARNKQQADFYYQEYKKAIINIGKTVKQTDNIHQHDNISVKLSALHPRFENLKLDRVDQELIPRVKELVLLCKDNNIAISFDAEEAFRLDTYLHILTAIIQDSDFKGYNGIGVVIQAYQKRAFSAIEHLANIAKESNKNIPIRLVKGAYWDYEIKTAQEHGMEGYPVFTKKEYTDVSYITCAQFILQNRDCFYPQFATHNAHTVAAIKELAGDNKFEFQKLHGMGEALHKAVTQEKYKCRIYCPVGEYKELLPYLMRRLLENGANTSFVNLIADKAYNIEDIVACPIEKSKKSLEEEEAICMPCDIFSSGRKNSIGYELGFANTAHHFTDELEKHHSKQYNVASIINGKTSYSKDSNEAICAPNDLESVVGSFSNASDNELKTAIESAHNAFADWSTTNVEVRATIVEKLGDLLHENRFELYSILMREAGKNILDAIDEVKEAIDFTRYYAKQAIELMAKPQQMDSYTGEEDFLSWHGKGVFVCVSPWNFPLAIFIGQIVAAIVTGNTVIAKPAAPTPIIAHKTISLLLEAGLPKNIVHLVVTGGRSLSDNIISDNRTTGVCFTGSTGVALTVNRTLAARDCAIATVIAETGGQNCMVVDSSALLEQATDDIIKSAFGSIGQRCSALRVLYVQKEVYEKLLDLLIGAMNELSIGNTLDLSNDLGAVISESSKKELEDHVANMKNKRHKILAIHKDANNEQFKKGHYFAPHIIEINDISDIEQENFGAILHIKPFKYKQLDETIEEINSTGFGLTFGVHSRIQERIDYIKTRIKAGNIYINRTMIGAQVETQCFGGEGISGTGFKAGGPNYLRKFMTERLTSNNTTAIGGNVALLSKNK